MTVNPQSGTVVALLYESRTAFTDRRYNKPPLEIEGLDMIRGRSHEPPGALQ
jgi:hypothetical protein